MSQKSSLLVLFACVCIAACKEEDAFANNHSAEVRYDCEETVECLAARGNPLTGQPVEDCVSSSKSDLGDFSDRQRDVWLARFERCQAFQNCNYYDCTQANTAYSMAHFAQIQHDCTQRIACRNSRGEMLPESTQNYCVTETSVMLDIADAASRTAFEARFARCGAMVACMYNDCQ